MGDLDVGIGDAETLGEQGNGVVGLVLDESEHVGRGLPQVFVCGHSGKWNFVREPIDGQDILDVISAGDVALVAPPVH